jgi:short-chain Z-isoprenyl diphosphate synthase
VAIKDLLYKLYEQRLATALSGKTMPRHVGLIIDGNRRWARDAGLTAISDGHRAGAAKVEQVIGWSHDAGVEAVTVWLLSTENMSRPEEELRPLLQIIEGLATDLSKDGQPWRLTVLGALDLLPDHTAAILKDAANRTDDRTGMRVNIAVGYGGRREIADAVRSLLLEHANRGSSIEELAEILSADHIAEHLYTRGQPDLDLIIRTSGEQRLSGFLLWQSVYSEFYFCDAYWPAFRRAHFLRAMRDYANRHRRYGG